jgi:hypothetical protein
LVPRGEIESVELSPGDRKARTVFHYGGLKIRVSIDSRMALRNFLEIFSRGP